jgi:DNA-binding transcriptional LysR family regulator
MKSLKGITSFVAVASSGSFSAAAKLLGVSAVAVSKNVATLERQLGVRLLQRTTRTLSLTREGQMFYRQSAGPLQELEAAQTVIKQSAKSLSGLVRITSAMPFGMGYIMPLIPEFQIAHPKVQIELHLDDAVSDMVAQGYDVGIRVGMLRDSTRVVRSIAPLPFVVCGSAEYLKLRGWPETIDDLIHHNCLRLRRSGRENPMQWRLQGNNSHTDKRIQGNFFVNDFAALAQAAIQNQGLICVPLALAMPLFRAGQLRPVLTDHIDPTLTVYLHYPNRKNLPARTRSFIDFALERLRLEQDLQMPFAELVAPFIKLHSQN